MFSSSNEVFSWLSQFINLERGQKPKSFRLERMEALAQLAGNPQRCAPSIHIAGSKGKGSVTGMSAAILAAAGFHVARYMSPHVIDIRERICLNDTYFSEDVYCAAGNELREITETRLPEAKAQPKIASLFDPQLDDGCEPTYFELLTLFFFLCSRKGNCDVMTVETGMGGRLDSTNILDPLVSVITIIELEHTSFLGNTIASVAGEKAGIIKQGKPVILAKQCEEALEVFKKKAQEKNSPLLYFPEIVKLSDVKINKDGTSFSVIFEKEFAQRCRVSIPIPGKVQAENAALAIAAVTAAFPQVFTVTGAASSGGNEAIRKGLENVKLPGRFEKIKDEPVFIIDGAHTPESLALCIETFCSLYGEEGILLFGCAADKDAAAMARLAGSHFSKIIITTPGTFKTSNPAQVYEAFTVQTDKEKIFLITDTQEAINKTIELSLSLRASVPPCLRVKSSFINSSLPILGTGSFYLVSEIRKILNEK